MKKGLIIFALIIIGYILFAIYGLPYIDSIFNKHIYIDNSVRWVYKNNKWSNIEYNSNSNINLKKYNVYNTNSKKHVGKYNLKFEKDKWYIVNKGNYALYPVTMFAYKGTGIKIINYDINYNLDKNIINKILTKFNINNYSEINLASSISVDLNNDGEDEIIYSISNMYSESAEDVYFSVMAIYEDGEYKIIKFEKMDENYLAKKIMFEVFAIMDYNNDGKYELLIEGTRFSETPSSYYLYGNIDGEYKELIGTK